MGREAHHEVNRRLNGWGSVVQPFVREETMRKNWPDQQWARMMAERAVDAVRPVLGISDAEWERLKEFDAQVRPNESEERL